MKYPQVKVQLTGKDGNAFFVLGACTKAAKRAGIDRGEIEKFKSEAVSGDYNNLLRTCMEWFDVE